MFDTTLRPDEQSAAEPALELAETEIPESGNQAMPPIAEDDFATVKPDIPAHGLLMTGTAEQVGFTPNSTLMQTVDISLIEEGNRIRTLDLEQVARLKASIAEVGLLNPLTAYRCSITQGGAATEGFGLVAGGQRLAACRDLGHTEVPVTIIEMDELHRTIAECDENPCGTQLSAAERAEFTNRRKMAYEELHPEARHGGDRRSDQAASLATRSFADATAAATGKSARVVRRDAERGAKISPKVLAMVKGTKLGNGVYLDELKELQPAEQEQRVRADLAQVRQDAETIKNSKDARMGNAGKKGGTLQNSLRRPYPTGDRPACFAWLVEELAGFGSRDFNGWPKTTDRSRQEAVTKARIYAPSAVAMIKLFERTVPRQHGDSGPSRVPCLGRALLATSQAYVGLLREALAPPAIPTCSATWVTRSLRSCGPSALRSKTWNRGCPSASERRGPPSPTRPFKRPSRTSGRIPE
jgi:ParB-like chromosome segregation protein Spo0J